MRSKLPLAFFAFSLSALATVNPCVVELPLEALRAFPFRSFQTPTLPEIGEATERRTFAMLQRLLPMTGYRPAPVGTITHVLAAACGAFGEARALNYSFGSNVFGVEDPNVHVLGFDIHRPVVLEAAAHLRGVLGLPAWLKLMVADARELPQIRNIPDAIDVGWIRHPDSRYDHVPLPNYPPLLSPMFAGVFARLRPGGILLMTHVAAHEQRLMVEKLAALRLPGSVRVFRHDGGEPIRGLPDMTWDNYVTALVRD